MDCVGDAEGAAYAGHSFYPWLRLIEIRKQPPVAKQSDRRRMRSHKVTNNAYNPQLLMHRRYVYLIADSRRVDVQASGFGTQRGMPSGPSESQIPQCMVYGKPAQKMAHL
jgi:hypothetical protein